MPRLLPLRSSPRAVPRRARTWEILARLLPLLLLLPGCTEDSDLTGPPEGEPPPYGALVTPRASFQADPLLVDAYQALSGDGYSVAHFALSWSEVALGEQQRNWVPLDLHVHNAAREGISLSVSLELIHGGALDLPAYLPALTWSEPDLIYALSRFLRELAERGQGTIRFLWLGEGPDRYAREHPGEEAAMLAFYGTLADTLGRILPEARWGVLVDPQEVASLGDASFVRGLRDRLGGLGLSVYPEREGDLAPDLALQRLGEAIGPWADRPFAVLESGYRSDAPGQGEDGQSLYASLLCGWLRERPSTLELFCWSPIHDAAEDLADSLAGRRYPNDPAPRERYALLLRSASLRRLDGSRKPAREVFVSERP